mmetsp:Transcript_54112/g.174819  ORF Transcript_54112/g.174819 Transcript_54112/m.174819 type:complete len:615 (+) Transcript_54112:121-1965(+)
MSGTGDSVPDALGSREGGRNEYERALQDAEVLVSSGSDTEESVEYRDLSAGSAARRLKADHFTDFIDEVADGIGSYLHHLEDKQRGRVYDRHSPEESARWRQCVQEVHIQAHEGRQRNAKTAEAARKLLNKHLLGGSSIGGSSSCGALGPCRPPLDAPFQEPVVLPDGKPRLAFSGCFESGNLAVAESENPTSYTLYVDHDVNTTGYTQWFYFGIQGATAGLRVNFRIVNLKKAGSLFEEGMLPVVWSEASGRGWERGGTDVRYCPTDRHRRKGDHTLSFSYAFEYDNDTVFFAYHYPYTYGYLQSFLSALASHPYAGDFIRRDVLCETIGGVNCDMLKILSEKASSPTPPDSRQNSKTRCGDEEEQSVSRRVAVITGRVHPGESNASWMVHGFLLFLCSPAPEAVALREAFDWIVIPMLNPDGVIQGNYRCGLAGVDLNRIYDSPSKKLHPEIYHLKQLLRDNPVELFIDFHGHSKKEGVFFYGGRSHDDQENADIRLLPRMCAMASEDFNWRACNFGVQQSKLSTARLVSFLNLASLRHTPSKLLSRVLRRKPMVRRRTSTRPTCPTTRTMSRSLQTLLLPSRLRRRRQLLMGNSYRNMYPLRVRVLWTLRR